VTADVATGYAPVNGLNMYYENHGEGDPLVLLHGGIHGIRHFEALIPVLEKGRQVIAVELQGHGRTADVDRPLRYETMADDIAALIAHLGLERADVLGYSLGAGTALQLAIRHPGAVRRLIVVSQPIRRQGWYPEVLEGMNQMGPAVGEAMNQSPLAEIYPDVDWPALCTKLGDLLRQEYDWTDGVAAIKAPTLLVFADADAVRGAHIMEFWGVLGGGLRDAGLDGSGRPAAQLAIIPNATHYNVCDSPALATTVVAFLDASG